MRRLQRGALVALLTAATALVVSIAPAAAQTSGSETLTGVIVASGNSGQREVVSARIVATGVFNGGGQIVETPQLDIAYKSDWTWQMPPPPPPARPSAGQ